MASGSSSLTLDPSGLCFMAVGVGLHLTRACGGSSGRMRAQQRMAESSRNSHHRFRDVTLFRLGRSPLRPLSNPLARGKVLEHVQTSATQHRS